MLKSGAGLFGSPMNLATETPADSNGSESEEDLQVDPKSIKAEQAAALEQATRKRAGIPELELDALPSTIAIKMMSFGLGYKSKIYSGN